MNNLEILRNIPTCKLVEELKHREGVISQIIDMEEREITVDGPAVVLVVID